ncbi:MAG: Ribose 5-phosphate isomerase RpiA [Candidatus Methanohalarchaeum thermophilum]|uniref:Ribose-5-phosphate isomerase A n=1 Tax=Methanohalarchaeum thermophilum TaxID=1903181 RepID=A0A1Q6DUM4_METT1|nr:MAG: Ribose 5-phosphate isomerase RpiA [Candidatus Methanohalarchaeum thermophilum]
MSIKKNGDELGKKKAAKSAISQIEDGMKVGLGTGSTVAEFVKLLSKEIKSRNLDIRAVCTSYQTKNLAIDNEIPIISYNETKSLDIGVDGADLVDENLNLLKGGGAAHLREKIMAKMTKKYSIIVDETKLCEKINEPIPIEVIPSAKNLVEKNLEELGGKPILREAEKKDGPVITDNGNFVLDCSFENLEKDKRDLEQLAKKIKETTGIVEHGLFIDLADEVHIGNKEKCYIKK